MRTRSLGHPRTQTGLLAAAGLVLVVAGVLKGHQLAYHGVPADSLVKPVTLYVHLVLAEFLLGVWLVSGLYRRAARRVAILFFFGLLEAALWMALNGQRSCGCLGPVEVSPWAAVAVDLAIVVGLTLLSPGEERTAQTHPLTCRGLLILTAAVAVPGVVMMTAYRREAVAFSYDLRHDRLLHYTKVVVDAPELGADELVGLVGDQGGIRLYVGDDVKEMFAACKPKRRPPGPKDQRVWEVLESVSRGMPVPTRWVKTDDGYVLVGDYPLRRSLPYWVAGLTCGAVGLGCLAWKAARGQQAGLTRIPPDGGAPRGA